MRRHLSAIINPIAGRRNRSRAMGRIARRIEDRGGDLAVHESRGPGDARRIAESLDDATEAVLIVGGDGTVSDVVHGLGSRPLPIVIWPSGTENLLARELNMPSDPARVVELLLTGERRSFDVGLVNGRRFVVVTGVGFDAECVARLARRRTGHIGRASYLLPVWDTIRSHPFHPLVVEADGTKVFDGPGFVLVGAISRYAAGLRVFPTARCDDGWLDLLVFPSDSALRLLRHGVRALLGRHVGRGSVIDRRVRSVRITAAMPIPYQVDGDVGGVLPIDITLAPGVGRYLAPADRNKAAGSTPACG